MPRPSVPQTLNFSASQHPQTTLEAVKVDDEPPLESLIEVATRERLGMYQHWFAVSAKQTTLHCKYIRSRTLLKAKKSSPGVKDRHGVSNKYLSTVDQIL